MDADTRTPELKGRARRALVFALIFALLCAGLITLSPDPSRAEALTTQVLARKVSGDVREALDALARGAQGAQPDATGAPMKFALKYEGPHDAEQSVRDQLRALELVELEPSAQDTLTVRAVPKRGFVTLEVRVTRDAKTETTLATKTQRVGRWWSLLPPIVAVLLALCFQRLVLALLGAIWLGAAMQVSFAPHSATWMTLATYLWGSTTDTFNLYIILFSLSLVGMVHVMLKMAGLAGLLDVIGRLAKGPRSTRVATGLMGAAIFFDDYANTVVVGSTMRPLTDARRISREKLAYIVDSTTAPIAGVAVLSTWIGYEVGLFEELSKQLGLGMSGYAVFFNILALRFYCLFTIFFVFANAALGRDFGPMLRAERRAHSTGQLMREGATALSDISLQDLEPAPETPRRWFNGVLPIAVVLLYTLFGLFASGWTGEAGEAYVAVPHLLHVLSGEATAGDFFGALGAAYADLGSFPAWRQALSNGDVAQHLFVASVAGSLTAFALATTQRLLSPGQAALAWARALPGMKLAIMILILAWSIRAVCDDLGTSVFLVAAVQDLLSPEVLPVLTFLLAAVVAFATGTSWGTMGILMPAMIPLAYYLTQGLPHAEGILFLCFSAVLDGAIFGDH
ncbi:MAG: Na+/H+ antiporter NhaC family protein, partial [Myxococcota bacterium]